MAEPSSSLPTPAAAAAAEAPNTAAPEAMTMARKAEFALLAVCVIWGASFTVCKDGMRFSSPQVFTFLRMVVATAALAGVYWKGLDRTHLKGGLVTGAAMYAGASRPGGRAFFCC